MSFCTHASVATSPCCVVQMAQASESEQLRKKAEVLSRTTINTADCIFGQLCGCMDAMAMTCDVSLSSLSPFMGPYFVVRAIFEVVQSESALMCWNSRLCIEISL